MHCIDDSDSGSDRSLSPSPKSRTWPLSASSASSSSYSRRFANPISIPLKSVISPPSTAPYSGYFSLSPPTPPETISDTSSSFGYPSWPTGPTLSGASPTCMSANPQQKSSYISDEDLLDLEDLELRDNVRIPAVGVNRLGEGQISWSATRQPPVVLSSFPVAPPTGAGKKRRKSSPLKRKRLVRGMSPIAEGQE